MTHNVELDAATGQAILLTEDSRWGGETGAGLMRNRCAFTSRDMGAHWGDSFTYAVVYGWDPDPEDEPEDGSAMDEQAAKWGWDAEMIEFLREAHRRFEELADRVPPPDRPVETDLTGPTCGDCGHVHTATGCAGPPTLSDRWADVSPAACDCFTPPGEPNPENTI